MASTRLHTHSSLPAPVVHAGFSVSQSKSHVLAGVQDAYWSDDEADDAECPLCLEEMDISDLNFKPCICGYQVCRFCWHHIKENLNGRCPACRREYTDDAVQFKPIAKEDHKRLTQQKKQRERERKELDALGRRQLANVRVVQRNIVYVVGIGPRFAKEELIPTLRSTEYFGQYGKISKILLVKRTSSGGGAPVIGLYITYHRREDASRCIAAVDGTSSPGGGRELMRASHGTTKYCMAFLRGSSCSDHGCMNLHEWGDEKDCFTKEDLTTLKHTMKDTESRSRATALGKKADDSEGGLPRTAAWGHKSANTTASHSATTHPASASIAQRQARRGGATPRQSRNGATPTTESRTPSSRTHQERKSSTSTTIASTTKTPSQASSSRPSTPAGGAKLPQKPATPVEVKVLKQKESPQAPQPPQSPASSIAVESDIGSGSQDVSLSSPAIRPQSTDSAPVVPPGITAPPPGLSAPPGLPPPGIRPPGLDIGSSQTYQMSTAAQALLDDVKARRESAPIASTYVSPFPDFDRTLQTLSGNNGEFGGFSFNLDPKLAGEDADSAITLPDFEAEANVPFQGSFTDVFPALRPHGQLGPPPMATPFMGPPGISYPHNPGRGIYDSLTIRPVERQSTGGSSYTGSFNPFAEVNEDSSPSRRSQHSPLDDDRKVSRFGFARGRQGSTAASSPLHVSSPLGNSDVHASFYNSNELSTPGQPIPGRQHQRPDYAYSQPTSQMNSPLAQQAQAQGAFSQPQQQSRFQPFDSGVSEAQLRELIQSSRERVAPTNDSSAEQQAQFKFAASPSFQDPAIMSARFASPMPGSGGSDVFTSLAPPSASHLAYGPPPGLSYPPGISPSPAPSNSYNHGYEASQTNGSTHVSTSVSPAPSANLSSSDFPALNAEQTIHPQQQESTQADTPPPPDNEALAKAERKAAKKAAAAERATERQRIAQEKALLKAAERAKVAQEKALEKEKAAASKAEKERLMKEKAEKEKADKETERIAREQAAEAERKRVAKLDEERVEKAARLEKERVAQAKQSSGSIPPAVKSSGGQKQTKQGDKAIRPTLNSKSTLTSSNPEAAIQAPLLSKMPKKNKPVARPIRIPKEDDMTPEDVSTIPSATASDAPHAPSHYNSITVESSANNSRAQSVEPSTYNEPTSVAEFLEEIDMQNPTMDLPNHPFFDTYKINPAAKMPLEYGPLVHALSALSVGGGSFANNMPSGSIDNAVSSFQQLLETLTQTISDLLRLLPRTTWDDSSSFDGVLRDMLKGDDFLDDGGDDGPGKEDEVAALTLALERRARWMEVQLSKLEELHRDINTAAVRAVLSFNDNGWDRHGFMPRVGNTLRRFDNIGMAEGADGPRAMTADELEKKLVVAKEAAIFAEAEVREVMENMAAIRPFDEDEDDDEL